MHYSSPVRSRYEAYDRVEGQAQIAERTQQLQSKGDLSLVYDLFVLDETYRTVVSHHPLYISCRVRVRISDILVSVD